jgi:hypothetical protein
VRVTGTGSGVAVAVGVLVAVKVAVAVDVSVAVDVGSKVGVEVDVGVPVGVEVAVTVGVSVAVDVGTGDGVLVGRGIGGKVQAVRLTIAPATLTTRSICADRKPRRRLLDGNTSTRHIGPANKPRNAIPGHDPPDSLDESAWLPMPPSEGLSETSIPS